MENLKIVEIGIGFGHLYSYSNPHDLNKIIPGRARVRVRQVRVVHSKNMDAIKETRIPINKTLVLGEVHTVRAQNKSLISNTDYIP